MNRHFNIIELAISNGTLVGLDAKDSDERNLLQAGNAIYVYRGTKSNKIYIGQTVHFLTRHKEHYSGNEEKFNNAGFNQVVVVFSHYFNGSALDDVESQLITYFSADSKYSRNGVAFDDNSVINRTGGNSVNDYADRDAVASNVVLPLWEKYFASEGWVNTQTLDELRTKELVRYSPIKGISTEQENLIDEICHNHDHNYVINGDAGTGKTVLLTHLVAFLLQRTNYTIGVVVQPNWEETCANIFKIFGMNNSRLDVMTSTKMIVSSNEKSKIYDVIVVDESHKLSRKYGKQHPSFGKVYDIPQFSQCESHLEILQKIGTQIILMYDVLQAIRPANVTRDMFMRLTSDYTKRFLKTQFRIKSPAGANYTPDDYINGIKYLLYKDTGLLTSGLTNFNPNYNKSLFRENKKDSYFGYFRDQPLHNLFDWIERDLNFYPQHINRVLGGLCEDWHQADGKDPNKFHWFEGDMKKRWNSTQENWINSKEDDAQDQIGSVFAVQGIDLNKVGVLIGADLKVEDGKLRAERNNFFNRNGVFTDEEMEVLENQDEFTLFVLNIYYVLLTRGIDGIRLGFWHNDSFREYMEQTLEIS